MQLSTPLKRFCLCFVYSGWSWKSNQDSLTFLMIHFKPNFPSRPYTITSTFTTTVANITQKVNTNLMLLFIIISWTRIEKRWKASCSYISKISIKTSISAFAISTFTQWDTGNPFPRTLGFIKQPLCHYRVLSVKLLLRLAEPYRSSRRSIPLRPNV